MSANFKDKQFKVMEKWFFCFLLIIVLVGGFGFKNAHNSKVPPETPRHEVEEVIDNVKIVDPYRWLEDGKSEQTRQWINEQNNYTRSILDSLPERNELKKRITELLRIDRVTNPTVRNGRYFFMKRSWSSEQPVICLRESLNGNDITLIDPNSLSPDHSIGVDLMDICDDGSLMAYGIRQGGEDEVALKLFDVNLRKICQTVCQKLVIPVFL